MFSHCPTDVDAPIKNTPPRVRCDLGWAEERQEAALEGTAFAMIAVFLPCPFSLPCVNCFCEFVSSLCDVSKAASVSSRSETLYFVLPFPFWFSIISLSSLSFSFSFSFVSFAQPHPAHPSPAITSFLVPLQPPASHHLILSLPPHPPSKHIHHER